MTSADPPSDYRCKICGEAVGNPAELVDHLREAHEPLEVDSYAARTMADEQDRDRAAEDFHRRFNQIKHELVGD